MASPDEQQRCVRHASSSGTSSSLSERQERSHASPPPRLSASGRSSSQGALPARREKRVWAPYNEFDRQFWEENKRRPTHIEAKAWYDSHHADLMAVNDELPTWGELKLHRQRFRVDKAVIRNYTNTKRANERLRRKGAKAARRATRSAPATPVPQQQPQSTADTAPSHDQLQQGSYPQGGWGLPPPQTSISLPAGTAAGSLYWSSSAPLPLMDSELEALLAERGMMLRSACSSAPADSSSGGTQLMGESSSLLDAQDPEFQSFLSVFTPYFGV